MPQPSTFVDNPAGEASQHASQNCVFTPPGGGTTQTLVCEDIDYTKGTRALRSNDAAGKPHKAAYVPDWGEGTMTVQLKTATTRLTAGYTTAFLDTDGTTSIPVIVTKVTGRWQQNEITKLSIDIAEKVN